MYILSNIYSYSITRLYEYYIRTISFLFVVSHDWRTKSSNFLTLYQKKFKGEEKKKTLGFLSRKNSLLSPSLCLLFFSNPLFFHNTARISANVSLFLFLLNRCVIRTSDRLLSNDDEHTLESCSNPPPPSPSLSFSTCMCFTRHLLIGLSAWIY